MDNTLLYISEAAELVGITPKALRHYEKIGLLDPEREDNGYRLYGPEDILRLERIKQLQSLGLSLERIKHILDELEDEDQWQPILEGLLDEISQEIEALEDRRERVLDLLEADLPDVVAVGEMIPVSPRVQEYLDEHLTPEMMLREQLFFSQVQTISQALRGLPIIRPQPLPAGLPAVGVGLFESPGRSYR